MERLSLGTNVNCVDKSLYDESGFRLHVKFLRLQLLVQFCNHYKSFITCLIREVLCHIRVQDYINYEFSTV